MNDVKPQRRHQAVLTAVFSWLILAYLAGVGCTCFFADNSPSAAAGMSDDVALSADLGHTEASQEIDARLLPALATVERIQSMAISEGFEARASTVGVDAHDDPIPTLRLAPKLSPPSVS